MNLFISESWNEVRKEGEDVKLIGIGESEVYETFTSDKGELYKSLVKEWGRCVSKQYIDTKDGKTIHTGWIFQKRQKYNDSNETYLAETWVTVHEKLPVKSIKYFYAKL